MTRSRPHAPGRGDRLTRSASLALLLASVMGRARAQTATPLEHERACLGSLFIPADYRRVNIPVNANKARTHVLLTSTIRASLLLRSLWLTKAAAAVRGPGAMTNQCV